MPETSDHALLPTQQLGLHKDPTTASAERGPELTHPRYHFASDLTEMDEGAKILCPGGLYPEDYYYASRFREAHRKPPAGAASPYPVYGALQDDEDGLPSKSFKLQDIQAAYPRQAFASIATNDYLLRLPSPSWNEAEPMQDSTDRDDGTSEKASPATESMFDDLVIDDPRDNHPTIPTVDSSTEALESSAMIEKQNRSRNRRHVFNNQVLRHIEGASRRKMSKPRNAYGTQRYNSPDTDVTSPLTPASNECYINAVNEESISQENHKCFARSDESTSINELAPVGFFGEPLESFDETGVLITASEHGQSQRKIALSRALKQSPDSTNSSSPGAARLVSHDGYTFRSGLADDDKSSGDIHSPRKMEWSNMKQNIPYEIDWSKEKSKTTSAHKRPKAILPAVSQAKAPYKCARQRAPFAHFEPTEDTDSEEMSEGETYKSTLDQRCLSEKASTSSLGSKKRAAPESSEFTSTEAAKGIVQHIQVKKICRSLDKTSDSPESITPVTQRAAIGFLEGDTYPSVQSELSTSPTGLSTLQEFSQRGYPGRFNGFDSYELDTSATQIQDPIALATTANHLIQTR
ncbi:MAG: hypothetical protein Q9227_005158 [Pyrenula ochraceoflavens]